MLFTLSEKMDGKEICRERKETISLIEYANRNRHLGLYNDFEICVGNSRFPACKLVLACFSTYFEKMLEANMKEKYQNSVQIECVDANSMKYLIEFIYTGRISINNENICNLLSASDYLQFDDVKQFCFDFLTDVLTPANCLVIRSIADHYRSDFLKTQVIHSIASSFKEVVTTDQFKELNNEELKECIKEQEQNGTEMTSLYNSIIVWTKYDEKNRINHFTDLLQLIKLDQLPYDFLERVVKHEDLVVRNFACTKMLLNGITEVLENTIGHGNRILSIVGEVTMNKVAEVYNCLNGHVKEFPNLPYGRSSGCSVRLNDYVYYVGGITPSKVIADDVWRLKLTDQDLKWEEVNFMNESRDRMGATVFDGSLTAVGGERPGECYSSLSDTWQEIPQLIQSRYGNALVAHKDCLYTIGGCGNDELLSSVECLQISERKWKNTCPMQNMRHCVTAVCCDGFIYAIGGWYGDNTPSVHNSVEKYDPSIDKWTYVGNMNFRRGACSACVLKGQIFVVGGLDENGDAVREIECYEPSVGIWKVIGKTDEALY